MGFDGGLPAYNTVWLALTDASPKSSCMYALPASVRPTLAIGATLRVRVEGHERPLQARIRSIASEASFTPYYALNGDDASRLTYRAEAVLLGDEARDLPAGLPLQAERSDDE